MNSDAPNPPATRPCGQCGEPFELGRTDFFRVEYMDHGIWSTVILCRVRCLRAWSRGPLPASEDRLRSAPNRETK